MSKKNISQLDLRLDIETDHLKDFNIFYSQDLLKIDNIKFLTLLNSIGVINLILSLLIQIMMSGSIIIQGVVYI